MNGGANDDPPRASDAGACRRRRVRLEREWTPGRDGRERRGTRWQGRHRSWRYGRRRGRRHGWRRPRPGGGVAAGTGGGGAAGTGATGGAGGLISPQYPRDVGIASDPRVLFASDFENGLAGWTRYTNNTDQITVLTDATLAHAGSQFLRAQVTRTPAGRRLRTSRPTRSTNSPRASPRSTGAFTRASSARPPRPTTGSASAAGTPSYQSDGLANTVPPGDQGFWFDLDASRDETVQLLRLLVQDALGPLQRRQRHAGLRGRSGHHLLLRQQLLARRPDAVRRATRWFCLEIHAKANTVGTSDGELALWMDDALVGEYKPGTPRGRWLRDNFYTWGQYYEDVQAFEGFDFRSSTPTCCSSASPWTRTTRRHPARRRARGAGDPLRRRGGRDLAHRLPGAVRPSKGTHARARCLSRRCGSETRTRSMRRRWCLSLVGQRTIGWRVVQDRWGIAHVPATSRSIIRQTIIALCDHDRCSPRHSGNTFRLEAGTNDDTQPGGGT